LPLPVCHTNQDNQHAMQNRRSSWATGWGKGVTACLQAACYHHGRVETLWGYHNATVAAPEGFPLDKLWRTTSDVPQRIGQGGAPRVQAKKLLTLDSTALRATPEQQAMSLTTSIG
jgi:hypothetical protein